MKIGLVGAYDRYNYGDLLMPIVVENQIKNHFKQENIEFKYYGLSYSDMEYTGGKNTEPLCNMYDDPCDIVIFVGGQVLSANYTGMYMNLLKFWPKIMYYKLLKKISPSYTEQKCKNNLKCISVKPWVVNKEDIKCKKLIYNTVGGKILTGDEEFDNQIIESINTADYISIRERNSYERVHNFCDKAKLYPDSVINLSKLVSEEEVLEKTSEEIKNNVKKYKDYFVFQIKNRYGNKYIDEIARQIISIKEKTGLNCILLPIGYAQGHEDQIVLSKIYKKLQQNCYMPNFTNIYESIYIIKNSKMYVGTSLHGAITAITYEIPHMIVTTNLEKLNNYLETWTTTPIINTSIDEMSNNVKKLYDNYNKALLMVTNAKEKMINLVDENFDNINIIIKDVLDNE